MTLKDRSAQPYRCHSQILPHQVEALAKAGFKSIICNLARWRRRPEPPCFHRNRGGGQCCGDAGSLSADRSGTSRPSRGGGVPSSSGQSAHAHRRLLQVRHPLCSALVDVADDTCLKLEQQKSALRGAFSMNAKSITPTCQSPNRFCRKRYGGKLLASSQAG